MIYNRDYYVSVGEQILNLYGVGSSPTWGTCGGGAMVAYWAHNPETTFESSDRNYSHCTFAFSEC